jgi:hypothetical protein
MWAGGADIHPLPAVAGEAAGGATVVLLLTPGIMAFVPQTWPINLLRFSLFPKRYPPIINHLQYSILNINITHVIANGSNIIYPS